MFADEVDHDITSVISRSPWFEGLPNKVHLQLASKSRVRTFQKNSYLFTIGEITNDVYCILSGRVRVMITSALGQEFALTNLEPDSWLNDSTIIDNTPRMIDALVTEKSQILKISKTLILSLGENYPQIYKNLYKDHVRQARGLYILLTGMAFYPLKARLAAWILHLAKQHGDRVKEGTYIDTRVSQKDLAQLSLGSRQRVNKILSEWRQKNIIQLRRNRYRIKDIDTLTEEMELKNPDT